VSISNLNSNYYSKHFKWGRRVTNVNYAMRWLRSANGHWA
jgi:hypothetical protein